jgi:uncharacterized membrane protein YeaQ/YmgE (transglycosylase-associated protein family)
MPTDFSRIVPFLFAAMVVLLVYRRFRRNFGQQPLRPTAMRVRMGILVIVGFLLLPAALRSGAFLVGMLGGAIVGAALAAWGAQRTRFLRISGQLFYVPHTYTGAVVSLLFLGRIVYRLIQVSGQLHAGQLGAAAGENAMPPGMLNSPLTFGLYFVLMGYYVCYYAMVLRNSKSVAPEAASA